jgi:hypothetical protein
VLRVFGHNLFYLVAVELKPLKPLLGALRGNDAPIAVGKAGGRYKAGRLKIDNIMP